MGSVVEEYYHSDYTADLWVLTAWNGAGTAMVFESLESMQKMIDMYEDWRVAHSLPYLHGREAVNGEHVLLMYEMGYRPWQVLVGAEREILTIKAIPLHRIQMQVVTARYVTGEARLLEVWAESDMHAKFYAMHMVQRAHENKPEEDLNFYTVEQLVKQGLTEKEARETGVSHTAPPPQPQSQSPQVTTHIAGFGPVADLSKL